MRLHEEAAIAYAEAVWLREEAYQEWTVRGGDGASMTALLDATRVMTKAWAKYKRERKLADKVGK